MGCSCGKSCDNKHPLKDDSINARIAYRGTESARKRLLEYKKQLAAVTGAPKNQEDMDSEVYYFHDKDWRLRDAVSLLKNARDVYPHINEEPSGEFPDVERIMIKCLEERTKHAKALISRGHYSYGAQLLLREIVNMYKGYCLEPPKDISELIGEVGLSLDEMKQLHPELRWELKDMNNN